MFKKAYKFRLYPNEAQKVLLNKTFGCVRFAWNKWVEEFNSKEKKFKSTKQLRDEFEWMKEVSFNSVEQKARDFRQFKKQFFDKDRKKKLGRPNFKSKKNRQSFRLESYCIKINQEVNKIRLEKIGWVKTVFDRAILQDVKIVNVTISKDQVGDFYISIVVEQNIEQKQKTGKSIGVDVGLTHFAVLSNGEKIGNPRFFRENQSEIVKIQRHLARKVKGSRHYEENRRKLAKVCRKVTRQRNYFIHNLSTRLVNNFDVICIEDLNIQGMMQNHKLAKSIFDAAWSQLFGQLDYKCKWYGKELKKVDRFYASSKTCSVCGYVNKELTLADREWTCLICNTTHDRDDNASKNILNKSVGVDTELQTWRECKTSKDNYFEAIPNEVSRELV